MNTADDLRCAYIAGRMARKLTKVLESNPYYHAKLKDEDDRTGLMISWIRGWQKEEELWK